MTRIARNWRVLMGGAATGLAATIGFVGADASADPVVPVLPVPAPATVTQTVTVTPNASAPENQSAGPSPVATEQTAQAGPTATPSEPVAVPEPTPATSGTLAEYFKENGVAMQPQKSKDFTALNIVLPMPPGWSVVPDPNVPDAFTVLADRQGGDGLYTSNAQLLVYKLIGEFDPKEAITHGYVGNQQLFAWQTTDASMAEFDGFPSSLIEGTYRENDLTLNTSRRHVIAQSGADRYLVTLTVSTGANQVVATANATDAIVNGFKVSAPGAPPTSPTTSASAAPASGTPATSPTTAAATQVPTQVPTPVPTQQR